MTTQWIQDIKLNGRTYNVCVSDDSTQGAYMAIYYGLAAYGSTPFQAATRTDKMVQEQEMPEDC